MAHSEALALHSLIWLCKGAAIGLVVGLVVGAVWVLSRRLCCTRTAGGGPPRGLGAAEIEAIPVYVHAAAGVGECQPAGQTGAAGEVSRREEGGGCAVCLVDFAEGDELCLLPCGHSYHRGFVRPWLRKVARCPLCMSLVSVQVAK